MRQLHSDSIWQFRQHTQPALVLGLMLLAAQSASASSSHAQNIIQAIAAKLPAHTGSSPVSSVRSALGWRDCRPGSVLQPHTTEDVADIISGLVHASKASGGSISGPTRFLVRATHQDFFSHNNFSCPEGGPSSAALYAATAGTAVTADVHSVALDMSLMNQLIALDTEEGSVTVQAGITFEELEGRLLEYGYSLPGVLVAPHLAGTSLGGAISTAAHGSSLVGPATLAPYLTSAVLVDGRGEVHVLDSPGPLLEASLGLLGIITELTFPVVAARKVAVRMVQDEDIELVENLREMIDQSAGASLDLTWSPSAGMYTARVWHDADAASRGDSRNVAMQAPVEWLNQLDTQLHRDQMDVRDDHGIMCELLGEMSDMPLFVPGDDEEEEHDEAPSASAETTAVGWLNHMASARCSSTDGCMYKSAHWTPHEIAIRSEDFTAWLADARSILAHASGCPPFLITFRFIGESPAPLAMQSGQQVVAIDLSVHSSNRATIPHKFQHLHEELVQLTLCKYSGRPHWGLGTNRMFTHPDCPVRDAYGPGFDAFLASREQYDPHRLFLAPLFQRVIGREGPSYYPGCANDGECFCTEDVHCGRSHRCTAGWAFPEYSVCSPIISSAQDEL